MMSKYQSSLALNYVRVTFLLGFTNGLKQYLEELEELRALDEQQKDIALFAEGVDANKYSELYTNYLKPLLFFAGIFEHVKSLLPRPASKNQARFFNTEAATSITSEAMINYTQEKRL